MGDAGSVFISYRRDDSGWAANAVGEALRQRLGPNQVFLDNSSIELGRSFAHVLTSAVRRCDALIALIGSRWDVPPLGDRLADPDDWVRQEILLARQAGKRVIPVLVDRETGPAVEALPPDLRFLTELQTMTIRQQELETVETLAERLTSAPRAPTTKRTVSGTLKRATIEDLLRRQLPLAQQRGGNLQRLVDHTLAVLGLDERLVFLTPARLPHRPSGSATVLVTTDNLVMTDVAENLLIRGEIRLPRASIQRVEVVPTWFGMYADVVLQTADGDSVTLEHLFPAQARELADRLREAS